jgi:hypothetical protein
LFPQPGRSRARALSLPRLTVRYYPGRTAPRHPPSCPVRDCQPSVRARTNAQVSYQTSIL